MHNTNLAKNDIKFQDLIKKCDESGHTDLGQDIENDKSVFVAAGRFYQEIIQDI